MRIGLLSNLCAGRNDTQVGRLLDSISGIANVSHVETSAVGALPEALAELAREDVELLVVNGGDGTLAYALGEILGERVFEGRVPLVAVLRGGRTNMTALDLGTQRDSVRAMASLIERVGSGEVRDHIIERRVLRVQYGPAGFMGPMGSMSPIGSGAFEASNADSRYGMFFGVGVIHRAIDWVHRVLPKKRQGIFAASLLTPTLLARMALLGDSTGVLAPDKIGILADGSPIDRGESALVMATSLDRLFLGLRPFWGDGPGGVRLTSIAAGASGLARALPRILAGRPGDRLSEAKGFLSRNADRVHLRMDCGFTVDGELVAPAADRVVSLSADDTVRFVRA